MGGKFSDSLGCGRDKMSEVELQEVASEYHSECVAISVTARLPVASIR